MLQYSSTLTVIDNSGVDKVICIGGFTKYRQRYLHLGDETLVSVKTIHLTDELEPTLQLSKIKIGTIFSAIIVKTARAFLWKNSRISLYENAVILLNKQKKFIGTRIFCALPKKLRFTRHLRLIFLATGIV